MNSLQEKMLKEQLECPVCSQWIGYCMKPPTPQQEKDEEKDKMAFWQGNKDHIMIHENELAAKYKGFESPDATEVFAINLQNPKERMPYLCEQCLNPDRKGVCTCNNHAMKEDSESSAG